MIICRFNDNVDVNTAHRALESIVKATNNKEKIIMLPDDIVIQQWNNEEGKDLLIKTRDLINQFLEEVD